MPDDEGNWLWIVPSSDGNFFRLSISIYDLQTGEEEEFFFFLPVDGVIEDILRHEFDLGRLLVEGRLIPVADEALSVETE